MTHPQDYFCAALFCIIMERTVENMFSGGGNFVLLFSYIFFILFELPCPYGLVSCGCFLVFCSNDFFLKVRFYILIISTQLIGLLGAAKVSKAYLGNI